jgi:IMP dehydrogenase
MIFRKEYTYNDISLFSRQVSAIESRFTSDIDINVEVRFGANFKKVGFLMSAPMYDVTGYDMMIKLLELGHLPIMHRFIPVSQQLKLFMDVVRYFDYNKDLIYSYTIGINDAETKLKALSYYLNTIPVRTKDMNILICIDTANGSNNLLLKPLAVIGKFKEEFKDINIEVLSGNIVTKEASKFLYDNGVKFQRVSISTGSACSTSVVTGIYRPPVSAILEIFEHKEMEGLEDLYIIADGGFKETSDMIKAIAVGADFIMSGNLFAGYKESNSPLLVSKNKDGFGYKEVNEKTPYDYFINEVNSRGILGVDTFNLNYYFKHYRGMASQEMASINNAVNNIDKKILAEGVSSIIKYKENIDSDVENIVNSFKSSMSYSNSRNFNEFRAKIEIVEISNNSLIQRKPHV